MNGKNSAAKTLYVCKLGHTSHQPGICPKDQSRVEPADYVCEYCDYGSRTPGKSGRCPSCDAPLVDMRRRKAA